MEASENEAPKSRASGGRPVKHDVVALRAEWLESGLTTGAFLKAKGLYTGPMRKVASGWTSQIASNTPLIERGSDLVAAIEASKNEPTPTAGELWDCYHRWRQKQSASDYVTAEKIRAHLRLLLDNGLNDEGTATKYTPQELARIAGVAESVQRIQRLALGMSTENVGVEAPQTHVEKNVSEDKDGEPKEPMAPTFIVEMSRNGKFSRARPVLNVAG